MVGKRYMRGCKRILGPAQKNSSRKRSFHPEVKPMVNGVDVGSDRIHG